MSPSPNLMTRMRHRLQSLAYSSSLYQLIISGPVPKQLVTIPNDPWPGDAQAGQAIIDGQLAYAGQRFSSHPADWLPEDAKSGWIHRVHGFSFLRDLRAVGGDSGRRLARSLLASWLDRFEHWQPAVWDVTLIADRLTHIIAFHDFVLASAEGVFRDRVFESLVRQLRHLQRLAPGTLGAIMTPDDAAPELADARAGQDLQGLDLLRVLRGLVFAGVALPDGDKALGLALSLMPAFLRQVVAADGSCRERSPVAQARLLKGLIDIRQALKAAGIALPPELPTALDKACNALRSLRHADGGLALFNGSGEGDPLFIEALFTQSGTRGRALRSLPQGGYERMHAGRMLLLADTGVVPATGLDARAHAGVTGFELSIGKERLIVNCGAHPGEENDEWHPALAATAAHSTVTVGQKNSSEILIAGGFGRRAKITQLARTAEAGVQYLDVGHDGYQAPFGITHTRHFTLADAGDELTGEDVLEGPADVAFALRFHLHPLVQASLIQNEQAVLLRTPSGSGFRLKIEDGVFALEESLYYGRPVPRKSQQIVCHGKTLAGETRLLWSLAREKK